MTRVCLLSLVCSLAMAIAWQRPALTVEPTDSKPIPGFKIGPQTDRVVPGDFLVDPPTLENLGFRWYIGGDANRNATVGVAYRRAGETKWRESLPMLRVHHEVANQDYEPFRTGNLFAGSVMFLESGTAYEVRLAMNDPDGGAAPPMTVTVSTRDEPESWNDGPKRLVYPAEYDGTFPNDAIRGLQDALKAARPGDILLLHAGVYRGPFAAAPQGTSQRPIVLRPAGDGEVILEGTGHDADLLDLDGARHLHLEGLTLRHARTAIRAGKRGQAGAVGLVVRRCTFQDVITGIFTYSENSRNWYLADNRLTGVNPTWYPRPGGNKYMEPSHTGINIYGRGHVVCYNRIERFSDSLAIANFGVPVDDLAKQCVAVDFYGNDLSWAQDDCLEADYGCHNIRVYRNRCSNAHTGLSVQPSFGGPIYLVRNEVYGVTALSFKLHNYCCGLEVYHNTCCSAGEGFRSFNRWQNGHFRNNLILGGDPVPDAGGNLPNVRAVITGTISPYSTLDYNGYRRNGPGRFILWYDGKKQAGYETLAEFAAGTGHERHGVMVDYDGFIKAGPPKRGVTSRPEAWDLRLQAGAAAVDRACRLPNVNDKHTGSGADLGCHERGDAPVHYGPRPPRGE
ncbi:MAG: hypothetical protein HQ581_29510 [Planctomycetes bacterium]|nr:hypothetical protein [Planctomycetota bacterium]